MKKSNLIIGVVLVVAVLAGGVFWYVNNSQKLKMRNDAEKVINDNQQQNQQSQREQQVKNNNTEKNGQEKKGVDSNPTEEKIDTSNWKTYRNEEFGFEMKLPGNLKKWKIYTEKLESDYKYKGISYTVWFEYPLDKKILRVNNDPSMGYITSMRIWYIEVVPVKNYVDNVCDVKPFPKCRQGEILGRNSKYVFVSGFYNIQGAGYLCGDMYSTKSDQEKEFCNVCEPFSLVDSINNMIDFKTL